MKDMSKFLLITVVLVLIACGATSVAVADPITEAASQWSYEGRVLPGADGWVEYSGLYQTQSILPDGETLRFTWSGGSACYAIWDEKLWMVDPSDTWTMDWRVRQSVPQGSPLPASWEPLQIDATPQTSSGRAMFAVKLGVSGNPTAPTNILSFQDGDGLGGWKYTSVAVPGLDCTQWTVIRMVGVDASHYKVYVNGIAAPVYTGQLFFGVSSNRPLMIGWQLRFADDPNNLMTGDTDFIRSLLTTSLNEAPLPPSTTGSLTGDITLDDYSGDLALSPVKVEAMQSGIVKYTQNVTTSSYSMTVLSGTYDVRFTACKCLRTVVPGVVVPVDGIGRADVVLPNGDVDGDNAITSTDLSVTLKNIDMSGD